MFSQLVSDARSAEYEDVGPEDQDRLFYKLPWWKRVVIMGSGVSINLVLAFRLFAVVFMGYGVLEPDHHRGHRLRLRQGGPGRPAAGPVHGRATR